MKKLRSSMRPYVRESVLAPLFKMCEALLELFVPLVVAAIIDVGIARDDSGYVVKSTLLLAALGLAGLLLAVTAQYFAARAAVGFAGSVRARLFSHLSRLPLPELDRLGTSTAITRMSADVDRTQSGINMGLRLLLRSPFIVFGSMIMAFTVDVRAGVIFAVSIAALAAVVFSVMLITMPLHRRVQSSLDGVVGLTRENISGVRVIRAFGREEKEAEDFASESRILCKWQIHVGRISAILNPLTYVMINVAVIVLLYSGGLRVSSGDLTQGEVIALYNYMAQILVELIKLADLIVTLTRALASAHRLEAVLENGTELQSLPTETPDRTLPAHIVFSDVSMTYPDAASPSLSGISFEIGRGETVGIIGGTGAGKSSLVHLIPHLYDVSHGSVRIDGVDTRAYPTEELRRRVGIVMQKAVLFSGTIRDNLLIGNPGASDGELLAALEAAQASDVVCEKGGLDARVEQNGRNFSGGQRQRLSIARALVRRPDILILDDSSSALDYMTDARLRAALSEYAKEMTVVLISQRTASLREADKILVLDEGELVGTGTHKELLASCSVYREIHLSQLSGEEVENDA